MMCTCTMMPGIIDHREYLVIDQNLVVVQTSAAACKFADGEQEAIVGQDIRASFPEIIGIETILTDILQGKQDSFLLEGITREDRESGLVYFDLVIQRLQEQLIVYLADVTELMQLKQLWIQRANEAEVLLSSLRRLEDYTNKILASMEDVFLITTASGQIKQVNRAAQTLFGYNQSELLHQPIAIITPDGNFDHQATYSALLETNNSVQTIELTCQTKLGKKPTIEFSCFTVETEVKGIFNCVYLGRNITARKQEEAALRKALAKEKELRELKERFISMASHEFRNPLSSILVCVDLLQKSINNLSEQEQNFYLDLVKAAAQNMQFLLEDILLISRTEAGKLTFKPRALDLVDFCRQIVREIEIANKGRKINFDSSQKRVLLLGDERLLRHILTNLLSNAIKYSSETVELKLILVRESEKVIFQVSDRGIGIPPEAQQRLFESFYRAKNVGEIPGTGLGLSIAKKAVELHEGEITVKSEVGKGTTIEVVLPLKFHDLEPE